MMTVVFQFNICYVCETCYCISEVLAYGEILDCSMVLPGVYCIAPYIIMLLQNCIHTCIYKVQ